MSFRKIRKISVYLTVLSLALLGDPLHGFAEASLPLDPNPLIIERELPVVTGCFTRHLSEAIALNKLRMPRYSALTNGASEKISTSLIRYEKLASVAAWYYDWQAKKYQEHGIPILCDEFVSM